MNFFELIKKNCKTNWENSSQFVRWNYLFIFLSVVSFFLFFCIMTGPPIIMQAKRHVSIQFDCWGAFTLHNYVQLIFPQLNLRCNAVRDTVEFVDALKMPFVIILSSNYIDWWFSPVRPFSWHTYYTVISHTYRECEKRTSNRVGQKKTMKKKIITIDEQYNEVYMFNLCNTNQIVRVGTYKAHTHTYWLYTYR